MSMTLTMRDDVNGDITLIQPALGLSPYILITATPNDDDEDGIDIEIQTGGGVPLDPADAGRWLQEVAETMIAEGAAR